MKYSRRIDVIANAIDVYMRDRHSAPRSLAELDRYRLADMINVDLQYLEGTQQTANASDQQSFIGDLLADLAYMTTAHLMASDAANRFRENIMDCLGFARNPGNDRLIAALRDHFIRDDPEPTTWRDNLSSDSLGFLLSTDVPDREDPS